MKRFIAYTTFAAILSAALWLVITDSDLTRSCQHQGGTVVEANGSVTCELGAPSGQP